MEFLRAEGYDQLGEDEKEVLVCGNMPNGNKLCSIFLQAVLEICHGWNILPSLYHE